MDTAALEDLGLSKGEVKVFLTLLKIGRTKVGPVIEKSEMVSSAVHNCLISLTEKGLVSHSKEGKIKYYQTVSPGQLLDFVEQRKKNLSAMIPELEAMQNAQNEKQEAEIFQGTKGVIAMLNKLIEKSKRGEEYLFFAIDIEEHNEEIQEFFEQYDVKRKDKGLVVRGISSEKLKHLFSGRQHLTMRYTTSPIPSGISICNGDVAFYTWMDKPVGYLLKSDQISKMYENYFHALWKKI